ncbi:CoA ester lyase [Corynebacterium sp. ES2794-CONJ1]|uniref:HpcH/HpaI aldolase/citrate lyase family protein n=1 Tax=unclassified Corynebacterium TaxID=2624378 RepID=UPI0021699BE4|nr:MULTISPECIES: CoA ester lyase [unclassified Corynebacterium]MCS4490027.1 CoA ester lyase [Corynebacterium sp. ES2775-CONJ]MCS4491611.1 CoA ester lyase [Corynebacterium sp. ES2715-CONJ3]MCS4531715.1 CoA ester lyase [Corynebacterium sp. ES2730-CONJ]MCU9519111.1 CoA ester lyase [Corynebacterium sp. ES2794-CONJ1]
MTITLPGPAILFAPAGRVDIIPKAARIADMVILDLEDGAGDIDRDLAYENIRACGLDPASTIVRTIGPDSQFFEQDVAFVKTTPYSTVIVPKIGSNIPAVLEGLDVIAMIETPQAVVNLPAIAAHPSIVGLLWGAEDLTVQLGGTHSRRGPDEVYPHTYRDTMRLTRAMMHMQAAAHGKISIDAVYGDFTDDEGLRAEATDAARSGFAASACIHPRQVEVIRKAYAPEPSHYQWAEKVVAKAANYPGAFQLDGEMIDAPLIQQAHRIIARHKYAKDQE